MDLCDAVIQEYARIIFVDDVLNHPRAFKDHAPMEERSSYDKLAKAPSKIVSFPFVHIF